MNNNKTTINGFKDLIVYRKAVELSLIIMRSTGNFPKELSYDLGSQMRRAAISIPSNIAEGYRRMSRKEYLQFLHIAYGSCGELQSQTDIMNGMDLVPAPERQRIEHLEVEISKMLWAMIERMKTK
jgi:four helix bundle protein